MIKCSSFYCWYQYFSKEKGQQPEDAERLAEVCDRCGESLPEHWRKNCTDCEV